MKVYVTATFFNHSTIRHLGLTGKICGIDYTMDLLDDIMLNGTQMGNLSFDHNPFFFSSYGDYAIEQQDYHENVVGSRVVL